MNVLFIHQNFPGQFVHLSAHIAAQKGNRVAALTMRDNPAPKGVFVRKYSLLRNPAEETHPMLRDEESKIMRAEACAAAALQLKREGFEPDLIVAHPGWGEAIFIKDAFPKAKLVIYCEYYYAAEGQDVGFDPDELPIDFQQRCRLRIKNTTNLLSLEIADCAISPTEWQKSTYPAWAQHKIHVIHDGIDLERVAFNPAASVTLAPTKRHAGHTFRPGDEVVSYVARNLEPVRGFHMLMRVLPDLLQKRPNAHAIVVGGDDVSYGRPPPSGRSWREYLLREMADQFDPGRIHFVGKVPYPTYLNLLSVARLHMYWTTPFVLSWSFLEAATNGLPILASSTAPVLEFSEELGVQTCNFFEAETFATKADQLLAMPPARDQKPKTLRKLDLKSCLKLQTQLLRSL